MNGHSAPRPPFVGRKRPDETVNQPPPPGQMVLILTGISIGILLLSVQLWLLTVALNSYLAGEGRNLWLIALVSGVIFAGGVFMLWLLRRRPRIRHPGSEAYDQAR